MMATQVELRGLRVPYWFVTLVLKAGVIKPSSESTRQQMDLSHERCIFTDCLSLQFVRWHQNSTQHAVLCTQSHTSTPTTEMQTRIDLALFTILLRDT